MIIVDLNLGELAMCDTGCAYHWVIFEYDRGQ